MGGSEERDESSLSFPPNDPLKRSMGGRHHEIITHFHFFRILFDLYIVSGKIASDLTKGAAMGFRDTVPKNLFRMLRVDTISGDEFPVCDVADREGAITSTDELNRENKRGTDVYVLLDSTGAIIRSRCDV